MKKTLIALTLAALPVAASADVILYGQVKGGVEVGFKQKATTNDKTGEFDTYLNPNASGTNKITTKVKGTTTQVVDYGSRIGFKGHEHLNGDLKAIWQIEQRVDIGGGKTTRGFGTRTSFIGLQSDKIGTVKAGYIGTPVHAVIGRLDDWEYDNDVAGLSHFSHGSDASKRAVGVSYTTPNMGGLTATAYVSPSDNNMEARDSVARTNKDGRDATIYGLGATYENSGFFADVAGGYVKNGANNGTINGNPAVKEKPGYHAVANVGYDGDKFMAGVGYVRAKNVDENYDVRNEVAATVAVKAAEGLRLKGSAAYGFNMRNAGGEKAYGDGKYYQGIVGADYALSKRTTLNGQVGYIQAGKKTEKQQYGVAGVGIKHKF